MRSEVWRPAARLVTAPREVRGPARQALRLGCEELAARAAEEMLQTEARPPAGKSARRSGFTVLRERARTSANIYKRAKYHGNIHGAPWRSLLIHGPSRNIPGR